MWNPDVTRCTGDGPSLSSGCFRPAGLLFDDSGRLYMTSDVTSNQSCGYWVSNKEGVYSVETSSNVNTFVLLNYFKFDYRLTL
jgi:hypothetical protein